jgi:hypothetical protein
VSFSAPELEIFLRFTQPLEDAGIDYMVSGSVAAMLYGQPRFTTDIDLIVWMDLAAARLFALAKMVRDRGLEPEWSRVSG